MSIRTNPIDKPNMAERRVRVAMVFGGTIQAERLLDVPRAISLGDGPDALWPLPSSVPERELGLIEPRDGGYLLQLHKRLGGAVWLDGKRRSVADLRSEHGEHVRIGPTDYGIVTLGAVAFFFQQVRPAAHPGRTLGLDPGAWSGFGLSAFLHAAALLLLFFAQREAPTADAFTLPLELVRSFLVVPPPDEVVEPMQLGEADLEREEGAAELAEAVRSEAREPSRDDGDRAPRRVDERVPTSAEERVADLALLGALRGRPGEGNALEAALNGPNIGNLLGSLTGNLTGGGGGPGGGGLRTGGPGGGRDGSRRHGGGPMDTQIGGANHDRNHGGGATEGRGEHHLALGQPESPDGEYLPASAILRVVRRNRRAVQFCYERAVQRQPRLRGRIAVAWRIGRDGRVLRTRVASSSMRNAEVEGCITRQIRGWRFPEPDGGEVRVTFPFVFETG